MSQSGPGVRETARPGFSFAERDTIVFPIEHLSPQGLRESFRRRVLEDARLSEGHLDLFEAAFATWWRRVSVLAKRAPRQWLPPRLQHVVVLLRPESVHPFSQPINRSSWRLEASDFDPAVSNLEFAAYQLAHAERLGVSGSATDALGQNLSYLLSLDDDQCALFCEGCLRSPRSDSAAYRALGAALPALRIETAERRSTGKTLPASESVLPGLLADWTRGAQESMDAFASTPRRAEPTAVRAFFSWLAERRPGILLLAGPGRVLWDPDADSPSDARAVDAECAQDWSAEGLARVRADLEQIDDASRRFGSSLRDAASLPLPGEESTPSGLCYLMPGRHRIAYDLEEGAMRRRSWPAPPFESSMLGARSFHEWGHLAGRAGFVRVPGEREAARRSAFEGLEDLYREILRDAPARLLAAGEEDLRALCRPRQGGPAAEPAAALATLSLDRLPDFEANRVAARFLTDAQLQIYVRSNVVSHSLELLPRAPFRLLARSAFEFQYLRLIDVADPETYFLESTWFRQHLIESGALSAACARRLFDAVGAVLSHHQLDESRFLPGSP